MASDDVEWDSLPHNVLDSVLYKLDLPQDYIRFGAVCTSWRYVAESEQQKRYRISTITDVPPLLLIPTPDKSKQHRNLYSICEQKVYNCRLEIPFGLRGSGSSYGWWAVAEQDLSLTLLNPFSRKTIHLPIIASEHFNSTRYFDDGTFEIHYTPCPEFEVFRRVILSCNPSMYPSDCLVAAIYDLDYKLAFIRLGEDSWNYLNDEDFEYVRDILFHKEKLYAVRGDNCFVAIDSNGGYDYFDGPKETPTCYSYEVSKRSYLVESSKGDLLLIRRLHLLKNAEVFMEVGNDVFTVTVDFKVYRMGKNVEAHPSTKQEEAFEWIEIQRLDDDDIIFLGDNQCLCISASQFPNCKPNCIYFTDDCKERDWRERHDARDMGFFDLETRKIRKFFKLSRSLRQMPPAP